MDKTKVRESGLGAGPGCNQEQGIKKDFVYNILVQKGSSRCDKILLPVDSGKWKHVGLAP